MEGRMMGRGRTKKPIKEKVLREVFKDRNKTMIQTPKVREKYNSKVEDQYKISRPTIKKHMNQSDDFVFEHYGNNILWRLKDE